MNIWVDDTRPTPMGWIGCVNSHDTIEVLKIIRKSVLFTADIMSLDHDLGGDDTTRPVVLWMIENDFWPQEIRIHTSNPVGRAWLEGMIERYQP